MAKIEDVKRPASEHRERSEEDHKNLVTTANKGIGAIKELKKHYADQTIMNDDFGQTDLGDESIDIEYISFEIKK